uniref:Uncharacterized protein n=1 Tax=Arundo donax TaxID=35708 RepID=A0A0A9CVL3_ARUDO
MHRSSSTTHEQLVLRNLWPQESVTSRVAEAQYHARMQLRLCPRCPNTMLPTRLIIRVSLKGTTSQSDANVSARCMQERAASNDRGAGGRGDQLPLHAPRPPRRGMEDEAGGHHSPLQRRASHPRRRPQRARRH